MKPITPVAPCFDLPVTTYAENQPEYLALPAHRQMDGTLTTRWSLTWKERILVAIGGSIWLQVLTFNRPLQPIKLTASCPIIGHAGHDREV